MCKDKHHNFLNSYWNYWNRFSSEISGSQRRNVMLFRENIHLVVNKTTISKPYYLCGYLKFSQWMLMTCNLQPVVFMCRPQGFISLFYEIFPGTNFHTSGYHGTQHKRVKVTMSHLRSCSTETIYPVITEQKKIVLCLHTFCFCTFSPGILNKYKL